MPPAQRNAQQTIVSTANEARVEASARRPQSSRWPDHNLDISTPTQPQVELTFHLEF
jgi:hypothetical protein